MTFIKLPLTKECKALFNEYKTSEEVIMHSLQVNKLAIFIGNKLRKNGAELDLNLIDKGALLHDLAKTVKKHKKGHHSEIAYQDLKTDYPELAGLIRSHRTLSILSDKAKPRTWEEKVVYYANQITDGDKVVLLEEKLRTNMKKHKKSKAKRLQAYEKTYQLEQKILKKIKLTPRELLALNHAPFFYPLDTFFPQKISKKGAHKKYWNKILNGKKVILMEY